MQIALTVPPVQIMSWKSELEKKVLAHEDIELCFVDRHGQGSGELSFALL